MENPGRICPDLILLWRLTDQNRIFSLTEIHQRDILQLVS